MDADLEKRARELLDDARFTGKGEDWMAAAEAFAAALSAGQADARRWQFCVERDVMPVISNDGETWCMFVAITSRRRSLFTGKTPAEAVDAAIDQARGKAGQEVGK